ncbi:MAG: plastocyanin/azurin family copper-binding protein [Anaerolineae bacterium]
MRRFIPQRRWLVPLLIVTTCALIAWQVTIAFAQAPLPNAPGPNETPPVSTYGPVAGVDRAAYGAAASIHGDPVAGRSVYLANCSACHGQRGIGNVPNPGSDDGTVPPLNPIDPGFLEDSQGDPAAFAKAMDLFLQHGSRPAGDNPTFWMIPWGDRNLLTQQQIADVEAYAMMLNGVYWPDMWAPPVQVRKEASLKGDTVTYTITLINESAGDLTNVNLDDTLPAGLTYVSSYALDPGRPGHWSGSTVHFSEPYPVPQGGTLGPFIIVAKTQGGAAPGPNVAQVSFRWQDWEGKVHGTTAVSDPVTVAAPAAPTAAPTTAPTAAPSESNAPAAAPTMAMPALPTATPMPVAGGGTQPTEMPTMAPMPTSAPAEMPTEAPLPTATTAPAVAAPSSYSAQIVEPGTNPLEWTYTPNNLVIHVGDTVTWTNTGAQQHTVTADDGSFDSGLFGNGGTYSHTFTTAGTYAYHCTPHPWMKGTVTVQP